MKQLKVIVQRLNSDVPLPMHATSGSAGVDLLAATALMLAPGQWQAVPCGLKIALPQGFEAQIRPRSGLALKHGVSVLNAPGTIDSDYRGEIAVVLINHAAQPFKVERGMRIAQMLIAPVQPWHWQEVEMLEDTERGSGGFGSSGV